MNRRIFWAILGFITLSLSLASPGYADDADKGGGYAGSSAQVMQSFEQQSDATQASHDINEKRKHLIMFLLGIPLIVFLLITGALGIAAGVYGKHVFVWHMLFAGLSVTLAIVHAIVGLVWFSPF